MIFLCEQGSRQMNLLLNLDPGTHPDVLLVPEARRGHAYLFGL